MDRDPASVDDSLDAREPWTGLAPNFRDLGGYPVGGEGSVKRGLVFRSSDLSTLTHRQRRSLASLGLKAIFDLRSDEERALKPDRLPRPVRYEGLDVLRDASGITTADYDRLISDPTAALQILGTGHGMVLWQAKFHEFVDLPSARDGFGRLYRALAAPTSRPALVHCSTGMNRTGWAAAALLLLLGVPDEVVVADYLESGPRLAATIEPILEAFRTRGGDPSLIEPLVSVRRENILAAVNHMRSRYGAIESYFNEGLGVDRRTQDALRSALVDRPR